MNYTLNILRNPNIYSSRELAIQALDDYEYHSYGQPVVVLYQVGDDVRLLFAVGIDEEVSGVRGKTYQIINDVDSEQLGLFWEKIVEGKHITSSENVAFVIASQEEFDSIIKNVSQSKIYFIEDGKRGRIYKGDKLMASTYLNDLDGSITIDNRVIHGDFEQIIQEVIKQIRLAGGTRVEYKDLVNDENKIPVGNIIIDDSDNNIYIPKLTNEYEPEDDSLLTMQLGGISAGTPASDLAGKSISDILDMLLFPTYAPQFTDASITLNLSSTSTIEIYGVLPTSTYTLNRASASSTGQTTRYGGAGTVLYKDLWSSDSSTRGTKTCSMAALFPEGTDIVVDSKGKGTDKYSTTNKTTLLSDATAGGKVNSQYHIVTREITASKSVNVDYPIYYTSGPIKDASDILSGYSKVLNTSSSHTVDSFNETNNDRWMAFLLPTTFVNVKFIPKDASGQYLDKNALKDNQLIKNIKTININDREISYTEYIRANSDKVGNGGYRITFTRN